MSKFGLLEEEDPQRVSEIKPSLTDRIATFPPTRSRGAVDLAAVDAAAAPHGFVSRESAPELRGVRPVARRRRAIPTELTRHLAIRLNEGAYDRFVAYADRFRLTYHEALIRLLEVAEE